MKVGGVASLLHRPHHRSAQVLDVWHKTIHHTVDRLMSPQAPSQDTSRILNRCAQTATATCLRVRHAAWSARRRRRLTIFEPERA
jgi:hypothetical protein